MMPESSVLLLSQESRALSVVAAAGDLFCSMHNLPVVIPKNINCIICANYFHQFHFNELPKLHNQLIKSEKKNLSK